MIESGRISNLQFASIAVLLVLGTTILFVPTLTVRLAGRDAWLAPLVAGALGALNMLMMIRLNRYFPHETPVQYMQTLFGRWIGTVFAAYLCAVTFRTFAGVLRQFSDFTISVALPRTPPEVILLLMLGVCYYGVRMGLEVLVRVAQSVIIIELVQLVVSVIVLATKDIQPEHLFPLFENGPAPLLRGSLLLADWYGELITVGFLLPFVRKTRNTTKAGLGAIVMITVMLLISEVFTIGVFGEVLASRMQYGLYEVARYVSVANVLDRLDPIVMGVWIMLIFCKLSLLLYCSSVGIAQVLRLQDYRPVVGPLCLCGGVLSLHMWSNQAELIHYVTTPYPPYAFCVTYVLPAALLAFAAIRRKWRKRHA